MEALDIRANLRSYKRQARPMNFVKRTSATGEKVLYRTTYHWLYWLGASALLIAPALAAIVVLLAFEFGLLLLALAILAMPFGLVAFVRALATEIAVTSERLVKKSGLVSVRSEDMNLDKIEEVDLEETLWGALFDYGTVAVHGSGTGAITVKMVQSPERLRREIESARELARRAIAD